MENNKLFVYGILKRGYELDLEHFGAKFIGEAHINGATLYGIGRITDHEAHPNEGREFHGVGLRLPKEDWQLSEEDLRVQQTKVAHGELWVIPDKLWKWLDEIEQNGYCYTRKVVDVKLDMDTAQGFEEMKKLDGWERVQTVQAWVYEHTFPNFEYENPIEGGRF